MACRIGLRSAKLAMAVVCCLVLLSFSQLPQSEATGEPLPMRLCTCMITRSASQTHSSIDRLSSTMRLLLTRTAPVYLLCRCTGGNTTAGHDMQLFNRIKQTTQQASSSNSSAVIEDAAASTAVHASLGVFWHPAGHTQPRVQQQVLIPTLGSR